MSIFLSVFDSGRPESFL